MARRALPLPTPRARRALRGELVAWFRGARRDLPWRRSRDPYAIWISEAMLQQTRVETVLPYYARFLARLPDVDALAAAEEEVVLGLWSGLGYYSRARALRAAAQALVTRHGGRFPRTRDGWLELPGVGRYTAGAVLSIAFGAREALVDGNVLRVFARLFLLEDALGSKALAEDSWTLAEGLLPEDGDGLDPGEWNQALMELGATLCTSRAPRCEACPLRARCAARRAGRVPELPRPRARRAARDVRLELLLARQRARVLLVQRAAGGRMAGLWELPTRELERADGPASGLWPETLPAGLALERGGALGELAHTITHHRIRAALVAARARGPQRCARARWVPAEELAGLPLTGLTRKALALARGP